MCRKHSYCTPMYYYASAWIGREKEMRTRTRETLAMHDRIRKENVTHSRDEDGFFSNTLFLLVMSIRYFVCCYCYANGGKKIVHHLFDCICTVRRGKKRRKMEANRKTKGFNWERQAQEAREKESNNAHVGGVAVHVYLTVNWMVNNSLILFAICSFLYVKWHSSPDNQETTDVSCFRESATEKLPLHSLAVDAENSYTRA